MNALTLSLSLFDSLKGLNVIGGNLRNSELLLSTAAGNVSTLCQTALNGYSASLAACNINVNGTYKQFISTTFTSSYNSICFDPICQNSTTSFYSSLESSCSSTQDQSGSVLLTFEAPITSANSVTVSVSSLLADKRLSGTQLIAQPVCTIKDTDGTLCAGEIFGSLAACSLTTCAQADLAKVVCTNCFAKLIDATLANTAGPMSSEAMQLQQIKGSINSTCVSASQKSSVQTSKTSWLAVALLTTLLATLL